MERKGCFGAGHRDIPLNFESVFEEKIRHEILTAISDGYTDFYASVCHGSDQLFLNVAIQLRKIYSFIQVHAVVPYMNLIKRDPWAARLVGRCDTHVIKTKQWETGSHLAATRHMIDRCQRLIIVYDGREKGGTASVFRFGIAFEKEIRRIDPRELR